MSNTPALTDTRDMKCIHDAFRRALGDAPDQIASVEDGDSEKAQNLASYLGEVLWLLHAHHDGEDELLYPLLVERVPESKDLFSRMEAQHAAGALRIEAAQEAAERFGKSGSTEDGEALASACRSLLDEVAGHLTEEEAEVVPIASRTVTPEEWGAPPAHESSRTTRGRDCGFRSVSPPRCSPTTCESTCSPTSRHPYLRCGSASVRTPSPKRWRRSAAPAPDRPDHLTGAVSPGASPQVLTVSVGTARASP